MKPTLKNLKARAEELGATIDDIGARNIALCVDSPCGSVWVSTGEHVLHGTSYTGKGATAAVVSELLELMKDGLRPCDDPECDYCTEGSCNE